MVVVDHRARQSSVNERKLLKINETFRKRTERTVNFQVANERKTPFVNTKELNFLNNERDTKNKYRTIWLILLEIA